jgi:osmotically-inducible protein OsmY
MKSYKRLAVLALAACSAGLFAASDTDRKIEEAAMASYNFRTVLQGKLEVKAENGIVTLSGTVPDAGQKALAEDTVTDLPGVVSVSNQINVVPPGPEHSDASIALHIKSQLLVKAYVSATATSVAVKNGVVTLGGTADNVAQKELTEFYASGVDGVKAVHNEMVVASQQPRESMNAASQAPSETMGGEIDDASITGQIKFLLLDHKATSALNTKVSTENGVVAITGEASSGVEKALVTELAESIRGVKSVNNEMTVKN